MAAKSSGKTASRKSTPVSTGKVETIDVNKNITASVRGIENGFIVSESGYTGKGKNQQWFNKEYFSKTNPVAGVKFGGKK